MYCCSAPDQQHQSEVERSFTLLLLADDAGLLSLARGSCQGARQA
jgi:hypothetical protein